MTTEPEARKAQGVARHYKGESIQVNWEPRLCIHSANCWRSLLDVFRPREVPSIRPDAAPADEVAWVVAACPSGALSYERLDGGPAEPVPEVTTVVPQPDGPLYVRAACASSTPRAMWCGRRRGRRCAVAARRRTSLSAT